MKKHKVIVLLLTAILITTALLSGCNGIEKDEEAVAKVNGKPIYKSDFDEYVEFLKKSSERSQNIAPDMWNNDAGEGKTYEELLRENAYENLIMEEILLQKAEELEIKVEESKINEELEAYKDTEENKEKFEQYLNDMNISEDYFKEEIIEKRIIFTDLLDELIQITDEEAKEYYEKWPELYDKVKASHILVETEEEAKNIIEELNNGADFAELAKEKSIGPTGPNGGDLGYFARGDMVPEFESASFELEIGEISDVVQTKFGYHVIKLVDKKDSFEGNKEDVIEDMKNARYIEEIDKLKEEADIERLISFEAKDKENTEENEETENEDTSSEETENEENKN